MARAFLAREFGKAGEALDRRWLYVAFPPMTF